MTKWLEKPYNTGVEKNSLTICRFGDPILQKKTAQITAIDDALIQLIARMKETMYRAPGVGLAAPQVGQSIQLATVDPSLGEQPSEFFVLINPVIVEQEGSEIDDEGCLSLPGFTFPVKRSRRVLIRYLDPEGKEIRRELSGFPARIIQHEIDHLQGTLILTHASALKRNLIKQEIKKLKKSGQW